MKFRIYMTHSKTKALGPFDRFALWVQGCNRGCKNCIAKDAQQIEGGTEVEVEVVMRQILKTSGIEGITISGGEPFLQQEALCELIEGIRRESDLGVVLYTGFNYSEIKDDPLAKECDVIIDGEYIDEINDNKNLRGSANQSAVILTERYRNYYEKYFAINGRRNELVISGNEVDLIGIPPRDYAKQTIHWQGRKCR